VQWRKGEFQFPSFLFSVFFLGAFAFPCAFASQITPAFVAARLARGRKEFNAKAAKAQRRKEEMSIPLRPCVLASLRSIPPANPLAKLYLSVSRPFSFFPGAAWRHD
jgi:hypothetical protein